MYANSRQEEVFKLFNQGLDAEQIAEKLEMSKYNVWRYGRLHGLKFKGKGSTTRRFLDVNPFIEHTHESDYWLGMLISDGGLRTKLNSGSFHLGLIDFEHMVKYQKFLKWPKSPKKHKNRTTYGLTISHKETFNYLVSLGITPNKSKTVKLKMPMNRDILRGIFDGDGYAPKETTRWGRPKITSASLELLNQIKNFLKSKNIDSNILVQQVKKETTTWYLIVPRVQCCKFYNLMYDKCSIFLERKHTKMRHLAEMISEKQGELLGNPTTETVNEDNQQPSLDSNIFEGSTTNNQIQTDKAEDGNIDKSALPSIILR